MKILTLTTLFPNQKQPIHAVFVKNRIVALSKLCQVKVVAPIPWVPLSKFFGRKHKIYSQIPLSEAQESTEVYHPRHLVTPKIGRSLYGFMYFFSLIRFMVNLRKSYNFDLLDVHWAYPDGFAGVLLARFLRKPVTITVRGSDVNDYTRFFLRRKMIAYALKGADRAIAVCKDIGDKVVKLGVDRSKVIVIPNGIDIGRFYKLEKGYARRKLGLPMDRKIILSVGRLTYPKRFDHIVEAMNILLRKTQDMRLETRDLGLGTGDRRFESSRSCAPCSMPPLLIIVGDGEYRGKLRDQVEALGLNEHIRLVGSKPNEDLVYWYNAADVFCLASSSEGWPNVIFESLACGTPTIAYAVGGVPEVLHSEEYGILVREQTPIALARGIASALSKEWNEEEIMKYARGNTWHSVVRKVYSTFREVIREGNENSISPQNTR